MADNMRYYNAARAVPEEAQKAFNNGSFSGTDINPMWRIKKMTELFGPCGIGWYYEITSERYEEHHDTTMAIVDINLFIKVDGEWSKPIPGTGGNALVKTTKAGRKSSDEGYKMALTDALSVACKALGVGADIYFSKDRTKYTEAEGTGGRPHPSPAAPATPSPKGEGSREAAQAVGRAKLAELDAKMAEQTAMPIGKVTEAQKAYIQQHASDADYLNIMQKYGPELERLSAKGAERVIAQIDANNAAGAVS
jgi:hypothetical protein